MANSVPVEAIDSKQKRQRSPAYPSDGLETCFKWARKLYDSEKRSTTSTLVAVKHMGYSSLSGAARSGLSAMKKFGLVVEEGGEKVKVSDETVRLFLQPDESQRITILRAMAQRPEIIREMLGEHPDGLPSDESLKFKLVADRGFGEDAANIFIRALRETVRFARLDPEQYSPPEKEQSAEPVQEQPNNPPPVAVSAPPVLYPVIPTANEKPNAAALHVWSLGGGVTVEVRSNAPMTPKHFKRLAKYVELAAEAEEDDEASSTDS